MPLWIRFAVFFGLMFLLLGACNVYVHRRASKLLGLQRRGKRLLAALLILGALALVAGRVFRGGASPAVMEALAVFGSAIELGVIMTVALMLPIEVARAVGRIGQAGARLFRNKTPVSAEPELELELDEKTPAIRPTSLLRRDFLTNGATGAALVVGGGSSAYGSLFGRHDYQIDEIVVPIPGLAPSLDGYTIVQLSDIHFGTFVGEPELRAAVELVKKARPDLVVMTGDLVDHDPAYADYVGRLARALEPHARDGVAAIPGNHDYYAGVEEVLTSLRRGGAHVLRNGGRVIGDDGGAFALVGVDDVWGARNGFDTGPDLDRALAMVPRDLPRVLLCHNPVFFPEASERVALQLSGHTHGGQVQLGINPAQWVLPYGYVKGMYERDGSKLYVNRGFGTAGPPARVGSPPEVTRVVLTSA